MEGFVKMMFPHARKLTANEAPGIVACVEDIARKAGCSAPPVYLHPSRTMNAAIYPAGRCMIIHQGAIDQTGSVLRGQPSEKLQAIIAHEMGHWSGAWKHFGPMLAVIGGAGLIASSSVYLYDLAHKRQKKDKAEGKDTTLSQAFHEVTEEMKTHSFWENFKNYYGYNLTPVFSIVGKTDTQPDSWGEYFRRQVNGVAASAASLAVALPICRPLALQNEYDADAFAARITGKPDVYIEMLNTLHEQAHGAALKTAKAVGNPKAGENVAEAVARWFQGVMQETVMAHPTWEQRVAAIRKIAPTITQVHL